MARRNLDWVVGWWTDAPVSTLGSQFILPLISSAQLEDLEDHCIVERVVGQYYCQNAAIESDLILHMRMSVRQADSGGPYAKGITQFDEADEGFMWHKVHYLRAGGDYNMGPDKHPEWSHMDVRVNRRVENDYELCLIVQPDVLILDPDPTGIQYRFMAWLRVLVRT